MFLNLKKIYFSNIINPLNFSNYHYKIIIFNSKKNKMKNISKNIFKIILKFLNKFLFKNYYIILQKINFSNINKNLQNKVFSLLNERSFELIRPNFLSEFIGISMSTFLTKDPKFLLE
jgi:hypothetical protein